MRLPESSSNWQAVRTMIRGRRRPVLMLAATSLVSGLVEAALLVVITRTAISITDGDDRMELFGRSASMTTVMITAAVLVLVRIAAGVAGSWQSATMTASVLAQFRHDLSVAYLRAEWPAQQDRHSGQLQELLTTFVSNGATLITSFTQAIRAGFSLVALLGAAVIVDPIASLVVVVGVVAFSLVLRPLKRGVKRQARVNAQVGLRFSTRLNEISHVTMDVHVFDVHDDIQRQIDVLIADSARSLRRLAFLRGLVPTLYAGLGYLAIVAALSVLIASDTTDITAVGAVMVVMLRSLSYGQALQSANASTSSSAPFVEYLDAELHRLRASERTDRGRPVDHVAVLSVEQVQFEYHEGQPVLQDIDLRIGPLEVVGIVGPSGGGKTTLVQLLLGLRRPTSGAVLADDVDVGELSHHDWARRVTFVPQQAHLLTGTVADNIRFGRRDVDDAQIERAARLAHLHDDIVAWPEGYERQVGERGSKLSGGQQQRLSIARALVENPDVLILDEPTSALDARSESLVRLTLDDLRRSMSIIIVAHRPATLDICDRIMIIDRGCVLAFDTREALESSSDAFRRVVLASGFE